MDFKWLNSASEEDVRWFFNHLVLHGVITPGVGNDGHKSRKSKVKEYFTKMYEIDESQAKQDINRILWQRSHWALDDSDLNWLNEKDSFQCIYVWGAIRSLCCFNDAGGLVIPQASDNFSFYVGWDPSNPPTLMPFYCYMGEVYPTKALSIVEITKDFFQRWPLPSDKKRFVLSQIQERYGQLKHHGNAMMWLSIGNQEAFTWAWRYMRDRDVPTDYLLGNEYDVTLDHLVTVFDLWNAHKAEKELLYIRMKSADSQRKTRMNRKNRKPYQIFLTKEHKDKLDELAWRYDRKLYEMVEELISKEHKRISSESK